MPEAWIAEANPALAAFWLTTVNDGEALAQLIERTAPTMALFEDAKQMVCAALAGENLDPFELGYAAFIMNRCSRSGMIFPNGAPLVAKLSQPSTHSAPGSRQVLWLNGSAQFMRSAVDLEYLRVMASRG